jgi:hypothetical protein
MLVITLWGLFELAQRAWNPAGRIGFTAAAVLLVLCWGVAHPPPLDDLSQAAGCLAKGKLICTSGGDYDAVVQAVRELTPPGSPIYTTFGAKSALSYGIPIRYSALRPLVYSFKDRGQLVYSNADALKKWYDTLEAESQIQVYYQNSSVMFRKYLPLAGELGAHYIVTELDFDPTTSGLEGLEIVYSNAQFKLVKIP